MNAVCYCPQGFTGPDCSVGAPTEGAQQNAAPALPDQSSGQQSKEFKAMANRLHAVEEELLRVKAATNHVVEAELLRVKSNSSTHTPHDIGAPTFGSQVSSSFVHDMVAPTFGKETRSEPRHLAKEIGTVLMQVPHDVVAHQAKSQALHQ